MCTDDGQRCVHDENNFVNVFVLVLLAALVVAKAQQPKKIHRVGDPVTDDAASESTPLEARRWTY